MAPSISISVPIVHGTHLKECIESIFSNTFQDFELIVNDSSGSEGVYDLLRFYDIKIIRKITRSFEGRSLTISASSGEKIFILDETRLIHSDMLQKLNESKGDLIVIKERDLGDGVLTFIANLDKRWVSKDLSAINPRRNKSIIPRVYKRDVILKALDNINRKLPSEVVREIVGLDLELMYLESYNISKNIEVISYPEILHYGDERFIGMLKKYYRYGYSQGILRKTAYQNFAGLGGRNRSTLPVKNKMMSLPVQLLRGVPFVAGYLKGTGGIY
jgi:glycosyltransferase involved in cell wall biosynthesis